MSWGKVNWQYSFAIRDAGRAYNVELALPLERVGYVCFYVSVLVRVHALCADFLLCLCVYLLTQLTGLEKPNVIMMPLQEKSVYKIILGIVKMMVRMLVMLLTGTVMAVNMGWSLLYCISKCIYRCRNMFMHLHAYLYAVYTCNMFYVRDFY